MIRRLTAILALTVGTIVPGNPLAQSLEGRVVEVRLDNGMLFLLVPKAEAPVFFGTVIVRVGGVDDPQGRSGLAHLFEHMAFKGTPWIGTVSYGQELGVIRRIDSVAVLYTEALSPIPLADREILGALERRTGQAVMSTSPPLDEHEFQRALATALAETLEIAGDRYPSLDRYVNAKRLYAEMKYLMAVQSTYVVKDEFSRIVRSNGGVGFNAGTGKDYTIYYESFPANRLELWAMLESERFLYPVMREFYSERDVVAEERRMRTDDDPEGKLYEQFMATAMQAHPYRVPIVGWMSEVQRVTAADALRFRGMYYVPRNAVGVLVGDFDVGEARRIVTRYFGRVPGAESPVPEVPTLEPPQIGERRILVEFDAQPQVMIGYHKPNYPHPDAYVFSVIANIVRDSGNSSRLYRRLVKSGIAQEASIYEETPGQRYPNLCMFQVLPAAPHSTEEVEKILYAELDSLANHPVSEFELQKCKNQLDAAFVRGLSDNAELAQQLARAQAVHGDWRLVATHREMVSRVTVGDIMRVARTYFTKENRTVATLVRPAGERHAAAMVEE